MISIILAVSQNNVIGKKNDLPWHLPADLKHFAKITTGRDLIMGRKTYDSIISRLGHPLVNREHYVITTQELSSDYESVHFVKSLSEALNQIDLKKEVFIIGGAQIFSLAWPIVDKLYLTRINANISGDVYLQDFKIGDWRLIDSENHLADEKNKFNHSFEIYVRKK